VKCPAGFVPFSISQIFKSHIILLQPLPQFFKDRFFIIRINILLSVFNTEYALPQIPGRINVMN
jgi:hypothetical protein